MKENQAIIIDPGDAKPVIQFLKEHQLNLSSILYTHHHWDHTNGIAELKKDYDVPIWGSAIDKINALTHTVINDDVINLEGISEKCR